MEGVGEEGRESHGETLPQGAFLFVNYSSYPGRLYPPTPAGEARQVVDGKEFSISRRYLGKRED